MTRPLSFACGGPDVPLIFLHGFACDPSTWGGLLPQFPSSTAPALVPTEDAATVEALADRLPLSSPAVLVGHSMGGMVALQAALRRPGSVAGLVLIDAFASLKLNATILPDLHGPGTPEAVRRRADDMMAHGRAQMDPRCRESLWESIVAMDVTDRLSAVQCPVLAIHGGRGRYTAADAALLKTRLRLDRFPDCQVAVVADAGHFVHGVVHLQRLDPYIPRLALHAVK